jgi:AcrR family transcriptional regulator
MNPPARRRTTDDPPGSISSSPENLSPKSKRTRRRILDAALRLFAEVGYHAATNARIAEKAGLTRGAMLYHFDSREALVAAAAPHVQAERMRLLREAAAESPHGPDRTDFAIDAYWRLLSEPAFVAFAELEQAARKDPALEGLLAGAEEAFDRGAVDDGMFDFIQGAEGARYQAGRDLARFMLEGLARARLTYDGEARTKNLLAVVKRAVRALNRRSSDQSLWPD